MHVKLGQKHCWNQNKQHQLETDDKPMEWHIQDMWQAS